jgi:hypothetical protein
MVIERGGLKAAVRKLQAFLQEAAQSLEILPESDYRGALQAIPRALVDHVEGLTR